ncbi:MAG: hypothetical protein AB7I04_04050 [Pseudomonadales bacterium]
MSNVLGRRKVASFLFLAVVGTAMALQVVSTNAATPYPTMFERIDARLAQEIADLRLLRISISDEDDPKLRTDQMAAFMTQLRTAMVRFHEELLPEVRPEVPRHLHNSRAIEQRAEYKAGTDVDSDLHQARMETAVNRMQELAELQVWHLEFMRMSAADRLPPPADR